MGFYLVDTVDFWDDYGEMLVNGYSSHLSRSPKGRLRIERTGPFVPALTLPGVDDIVITTPMRTAMECLDPSIKFIHAEKARIVPLRWEDLDRTKPTPKFLRKARPSAHVWNQPHCEKTSEVIGELWEAKMPRSAEIEIVRGEWPTDSTYVIRKSTWKGNPLFFASNRGGKWLFVSDQGREFLQAEAGEWLTFKACDAA